MPIQNGSQRFMVMMKEATAGPMSVMTYCTELMYPKYTVRRYSSGAILVVIAATMELITQVLPPMRVKNGATSIAFSGKVCPEKPTNRIHEYMPARPRKLRLRTRRGLYLSAMTLRGIATTMSATYE